MTTAPFDAPEQRRTPPVQRPGAVRVRLRPHDEITQLDRHEYGTLPENVMAEVLQSDGTWLEIPAVSIEILVQANQFVTAKIGVEVFLELP